MKNLKKRPIGFVLAFYFACFLFRVVEYLIIRTDQSVIGEAFIHKLIGILLLWAVLRPLGYSWSAIGFRAGSAARGLGLGLLLGGAVFAVAYGAEMIIQTVAGNDPSLRFFATSYATQGNRGMQEGAVFVLICILGNIINVIMEEGVFRGLFVRLIGERHSFAAACLLPSLLFGFWHIAQPVRNVLDGQQSIPGAVMTALMLVVTSALLGIQYILLFKITGALWIGMAAHFVNNAITNLLHVVTIGGVDEMQAVRLTITQTLSFLIVMFVWLRARAARRDL